jgi:hypothetical protein
VGYLKHYIWPSTYCNILENLIRKELLRSNLLAIAEEVSYDMRIQDSRSVAMVEQTTQTLCHHLECRLSDGMYKHVLLSTVPFQQHFIKKREAHQRQYLHIHWYCDKTTRPLGIAITPTSH